MKNKILLIIFSLFLIMFIISVISAAGGGATVPITATDLSEKGNDYGMKPGRLSFEFENDLYAIQLRRVYEDYAWFLVMDLDENKQDDITAYTIENSFNLTIGKKKEIDLDKDGVNDISIELSDIISNVGSVRSADFSIKRINKESLENDEEAISESIEGKIQEPVSEPVIVLNQESEEQLTFFWNIISWFRGLFE